MKNNYSTLLVSLLFSSAVLAQSVTAVHTSQLPTDFDMFRDTTTESACPGTLNINVPAGSFVYAVDVSYQIQALGIAWISEQFSYLECVTTGKKEDQVAEGANITSNGVESYSRTGLDLADGITSTGSLQFKLHAFREFTTSGNGCSLNDQKVLSNTWSVTVHYLPAGACFPPNNIQVISRTATTVNLGWNAGSASNWQIEYGPAGYSPGNGTIVSAAVNPFTVTGLNPSTYYEFYVRDSCGAGDVSPWIGPVKTMTRCAAVPTPYSENFSNGFTAGTMFSDTGTIASCWQRDNLTDFIWKGGPPVFGTPSNTGPAADHTTGSTTGGFIYSQALALAPAGRSTAIDGPLIDLSNLTNPQLSFWYHMFGNNITSLEVLINDGSGFISERLIVGQQQISNTDQWKEAFIDLSAYSNKTITIRFVAVGQSAGTASNIALDDILVHEAPTCPKSQNINVLSATNQSVILDWLPGGSASFWNIEYGPPGFSPGTGTVVTTNTRPFTLTGLTSNSAYDIYIRDSCGSNDLSVWVGPLRAATECDPVLAPWTENFEGPDFTMGSLALPGTVNSCWEREANQNYVWTIGINGTSSFGTGPAKDHTTGTGKFLYSEAFFGANTSLSAEVETQLIDLSPLTIPELTFWYHMYGANIDSLVLHVNDGTTWNREWYKHGQQQTLNESPWIEAVVNLGSYADDTIKIRFTAYKSAVTAQACDIAIDDLDVHEQPTCPKPSNLSITSSTGSSITFAWTSGGATNWQFQYRPVGGGPGTGTIVNASTNPFTLTGLNGSTTYDIYIRDSCGVGDVSFWVGPIIASTACEPLQAPFFEDFEGQLFSPGITFNDTGTIGNCWSRTPLNNFFWVVGPEPFNTANTGPAVDHTTGTATGKFMFSEASFFGTPLNTFLETPYIDLSTLSTPELSFWYHSYGVGINALRIQIDDGSGYAPLGVILGQEQNSTTDKWKEKIISLAAYANDTVRLKFRAVRNSNAIQADISIDDVSIHETPTCAKPSGFQVLSTGADQVELSWTGGGATNWQIEYGPMGFSPGTGTIVTTSTVPFTITGLTPNTSYTFYVRDSCGVGDVSFWVGPLSDTTLCTVNSAPYFENFDDTDWKVSSNVNDPGEISECWDRDATTQYFWTVGGPLGTPGSSTGPEKDHTTGFGKYIYSEGFVSGVTRIYSPLIDLSALTSPQLRYWYHMYGSQIIGLDVEVNDGSGWTLMSSFNNQQQTSSAAAWKEAIVSLTAFTNDTIQLRFTAESAMIGLLKNVAIDDVWIGETPNCTRPTNLSIQTSATTTTSLNLIWSTGGASNWQIGYRQFGSNNPLTFVSGSSPFTLSGLNPSTTYEIYVRDSCGPGNVSLWEGPAIGKTNCGVVSIPYYESFDGTTWVEGTGFYNSGDQIDNCWTRNSSTGLRWGTGQSNTPTFGSGPNTDASGIGKYIYVESDNGTGVVNVNSPWIYLDPAYPNPELHFSYHMYGLTISSLGVQIDNGSGWSGNLIHLNGQRHSNEYIPWSIDSLDLNSYSGDTIMLRFVADIFGNTADIAIDELRITADPPLCLPPTGISVSNITSGSVDVSWNVGGGLSHLRYYELSAGPGTATDLGQVSSPQTITGLLASANYVVEVYDSCGASLFSGAITDTFTTAACAPPVADFSASVLWLNVNCNSGSTTNADSLYWDFGDGNFTSGNNPSHIYSASGNYQIILYAFNNCGASDTLMIPVLVCDTLSADFNFVLTSDSVYFVATDTTGVSEYIWDFGDGNTGSGVSPTHDYDTTGTYNVSLTVINICGDSITMTKIVKECLPPVASWTYNIISSGVGGMKVKFDASASQNAIQYLWDFGDGNTTTGSVQPEHIYSVPSLNYLVRLVVVNTCGDDDTLQLRLNQVGIEEIQNRIDFTMFPNPVKDRLILRWETDNLNPFLIQIYDNSGKEIRRLNSSATDLEAKEVTIEMKGVAAGNYSIVISGDTWRTTSQLIIDR